MMSSTAPITAPMRAGVQKEVLASAMEEDTGEGYLWVITMTASESGGRELCIRSYAYRPDDQF
jgi:hypothetical protein